MADMVRFGRAVRALRRKRRWRQRDLAKAARVSRERVSRIERGLGDSASIDTLDRLGNALGARTVVRLDWNGEALDRLLDADHAALVELLVRGLRAAGWEVSTEVTFAIGGERGSVDVLAWHVPTQSMLIAEVKTVVPDIQGMLASLDRKVRLGVPIGRQLGFHAVVVGRLLVIAESRTSRRRVDAHRETFGLQFPDRIAAIRSWLAKPSAERPLRGLWFLPTSARTDRHRIANRGANRGADRGANRGANRVAGRVADASNRVAGAGADACNRVAAGPTRATG